MKRMILMAVLATAVALTGACSNEYEPSNTNNTESALSEQEIAEIAIDITWDSMSFSDQRNICTGWTLYRDEMTDAFLEGLYSEGDPGISRDVAIDVLEAKIYEEC